MSKLRIAGWILCSLLALALTASAVSKFFITAEDVAKLPIGWEQSQIFALGIIELACVLLYIIPTRLSFLGLILLTAYMGGAVAAHVRIHEAPVPQVIIGVLLWVAYSLAHPDVFLVAFGFPTSSANKTS